MNSILLHDIDSIQWTQSGLQTFLEIELNWNAQLQLDPISILRNKWTEPSIQWRSRSKSLKSLNHMSSHIQSINSVKWTKPIRQMDCWNWLLVTTSLMKNRKPTWCSTYISTDLTKRTFSVNHIIQSKGRQMLQKRLEMRLKY